MLTDLNIARVSSAGMLLVMVVCVTAAFLAWNAAMTAAREAERAALLQGTAALQAIGADVQPARPCLAAVLASLNPEQALGDVAAGHPASLSFRRVAAADAGDVSLQTCLLANGIDSIAVEATGLRSIVRFALDEASAQAMRSAIEAMVGRYEDLASAASVPPTPDPVACRLAVRLPGEVRAFVDVLGRNLHRADLRGWVSRAPHLLAWSAQQHDACPALEGFERPRGGPEQGQ